MKSQFATSCVMIYWNCPTDTRAAQSAERKFRKALRALGAGNVGRIVRGTWCTCWKSVDQAESALLPVLPPDGEIRIVGVTEKQMQLGRCHWGEIRTSPAAMAGSEAS